MAEEKIPKKKSKSKILLIEDDPMIVEMYKMRLEEEGYQVLVTEKGSEAIELAKNEKPILIILDIILPETDGFSILENFKREFQIKNIPVLVLTNLGQESDKFKGIQRGADKYFVKSRHTPAEVVAEVRKLIHQTRDVK